MSFNYLNNIYIFFSNAKNLDVFFVYFLQYKFFIFLNCVIRKYCASATDEIIDTIVGKFSSPPVIN